MQNIFTEFYYTYGLVTIVLGCVVVPFIVISSGMVIWFITTMNTFGKISLNYSSMLTQLALRNGWRSDKSRATPSILGQLSNYTEWKMSVDLTEPASIRWLAELPTDDDAFLVIQKRGTKKESLFGRMKRYMPTHELYSADLNRRYYIRTTDPALGDTLLTPTISKLLHSWQLQRFPRNPSKFKIQLEKNQLTIDITPTRDERAILALVSMGEALVEAYVSPN